MKFLAINTAGAAVEVALYTDGKTVYKRDAQFKKASAVCLPFVDELLAGSKLTLTDLDFIGVCTGPGSFTGIRIGLTAARAFAQFASLPLLPVTATEILAYNTECARAVTLLDAANGFVYAACYEGKPRKETTVPFVLAAAEVKSFLDSQDLPFSVCADPVCRVFAENAAAEKTDCTPLISAVRAAYETRGTVPFSAAVPLYVRKSQAEENGAV